MTTRNADSCQQPKQGEGGNPVPAPSSPGLGDNQQYRNGNVVFKSGPLFISSKGIGWTSWKKRWFILTRTSLVFFRSDPNAVPQKGSEVNLILGGIDLNNSGSVVVKADKKLVTVLFPDGRDGRAFTLKAETLEDLYEWKTALENALEQAPSATVMGQNGIFKNEHADGSGASSEQLKDKQPIKTSVIGRPVLLALEDVDGSPSFLEKALRFIEEHGVKVEGILRQAADVEDVERRIQDYEQGKAEFSPDEDAHVIGDCIKYILREMPSSPVPASCCNALLEASRADRSVRLNAIREAISETFPEPNRRLLQRILMMMQRVATQKTINRMSSSAVAACMAPLLLRPLLAGDCEIEHDFDVGGDGSFQLLQAAAAANHAQAIVITLLEEYDNIFREGTMSPEIYSDTQDSGTESEDATDDDYSYEDDEEDDGTEGSDANTDYDNNYTSGGSSEEIGYSGDDNTCDEKSCDSSSSVSKSPKESDDSTTSQIFSSSQPSLSQHKKIRGSDNVLCSGERSPEIQASESAKQIGKTSPKESSVNMMSHGPPPSVQKSSAISDGPTHGARRRTVWGRTSAKKNLSMESIDCPLEDDDEIQQLELSKVKLQNKIAEEVKGNSILQTSLETRKKDLRERRLALEKEVERLQEQLQKHTEWRITVEAGLNMSLDLSSVPESVDEKTKADLMEIAEAAMDVSNLKQKVDNLGDQLLQQQESVSGSMHLFNQSEQTSYNQEKRKEKERDIEIASAFNLEKSAGSKDKLLDGAIHVNKRNFESTSLPNQGSHQNYQSDLVHSASSKYGPTTKRSGSRGQGSSSAASAVSKLTNRLNFLKERRSQIANELHNMEKGRGSSQNSEKIKGSDSQQIPRDLDSSQDPERRDGQSLENSGKGIGTEGELQEVSEKLKKSSIQSRNEEENKKRNRSRSSGKGSSVLPKTHTR